MYKKLRLLVDWGCIFIGHGFSKNFQVISQFLTCLWYSKVFILDYSTDIFVWLNQVIFLHNCQCPLSPSFTLGLSLKATSRWGGHDLIGGACSALKYCARHTMSSRNEASTGSWLYSPRYFAAHVLNNAWLGCSCRHPCHPPRLKAHRCSSSEKLFTSESNNPVSTLILVCTFNSNSKSKRKSATWKQIIQAGIGAF